MKRPRWIALSAAQAAFWATLPILLYMPTWPAVAERQGDIRVRVINIKAVKGTIQAALHTSPQTFPMKPERALRRVAKRVVGKEATLLFSNVPYSRYAISLYHDENDNQKLDFNFIGIPKEGVAASRDAKGFMGPPKFKDAAFTLDRAKLDLTVAMIY